MADLSDLTAYRLTVGHCELPTALEGEHQRFSWRLRSDTQGRRQLAFSIRVDSSDGEPIVGNSEWIYSADPFVTLRLPRLSSRKEYVWTLQLLDDGGRESGTFVSRFTMGLLQADDFVGEWIARDRHLSGHENPPAAGSVGWRAGLLAPPSILRTKFTLDRAPRRALLYASARGVYRAYLNGTRIGDAELAPGWTDFEDHELYQCIDVTQELGEGPNALAFELAAGWWSGYMGFDPRAPACHYGNDPQLWCRLVVELPDGPPVDVVTSSEWKESIGKRVFADLLVGEYIDDDRDPGQWASPDYDDSNWSNAVAVDSDL